MSDLYLYLYLLAALIPWGLFLLSLIVMGAASLVRRRRGGQS